MNSISVVGLGKLGLPLAACLARQGYQVVGVDLNQHVIQAVNDGKSPYYEPGLSDLLNSVRGNLSACGDYSQALSSSELIFLVVPTPSEPDGSFSTKYVETSAAQVAMELKRKDNFHVIVITSTVLPGVTEGVIKPLIERVSGKKCGQDFGLCYSPEFIALGSVIRDFTNPDVVLIGESEPRSGDLLAEVYRRVCENQAPIVRTTIANAELAKISLNAYVTMKITFANTLAEIAEKIPGGDVDIISQMLGLDSRIGRKYLTGGLSYGGPCFPRDNKAFAHVARYFGCQKGLSLATHEANEAQVNRIVCLVEQSLGGLKGKAVAILGLTYKPNTDVVEESASVKIAHSLRKKGSRLSLYDPAGMVNAEKILGNKDISYAASAKKCLQNADFCILATPWNEFKSLQPADFTANMKNPRLLDCWRVFDRFQFSEKMDYLSTGLNLSR